MRFSLPGEPLPAVEAVYYLTPAGRLWKPPASVYLPVAFDPPAHVLSASCDALWLALAGQLSADMRRRGVAGRIALPPEISDIRPWQQAGFDVCPGYTFITPLPYDELQLDSSVRRQISRSRKSGFRCSRVGTTEDVYVCLNDSQQRQAFSYRIGPGDLEAAQQMIGDDVLRSYVCYAPNGEPAAGATVVHRPGACAIGWAMGTRTAYLHSGATQLLIAEILDDLAASGARAFDFSGANLPGVAAAKSYWGAHLVPFYVIAAPGLKTVARRARDWAHFRHRKHA